MQTLFLVCSARCRIVDNNPILPIPAIAGMGEKASGVGFFWLHLRKYFKIMAKEKSERLAYKVFTRIGKARYDELSDLLEHSTCRTMSALLRAILMHDKILVQTHDVSLDKVMEQLSSIRKELHAIGVNINQITRQFNLYPDFEHRIFLASEVATKYKQTGEKVDELFDIIAKISERWLPE